MRALVVYESMYGNTHEVAAHIADGLASAFAVSVVPVGEASTDLVAAADLLVVGGPTHVHGMASARSRQAAVDAADEDASLEVDPDALSGGLREWLSALEGAGSAAAFDTRVDGPPALTGRASRGIARRLRRKGRPLVAEPESFLVDRDHHLIEGEAARAETWAAGLAREVLI